MMEYIFCYFYVKNGVQGYGQAYFTIKDGKLSKENVKEIMDEIISDNSYDKVVIQNIIKLDE